MVEVFSFTVIRHCQVFPTQSALNVSKEWLVGCRWISVPDAAYKSFTRYRCNIKDILWEASQCPSQSIYPSLWRVVRWSYRHRTLGCFGVMFVLRNWFIYWNPKDRSKMTFPCVTLDIHLTSMCIDFVHCSETELTKQNAHKKNALTFYCPCPDQGQNNWTLYVKILHTNAWVMYF